MSDASPARPQATEIAREVRFAVVMYGGVSLAIYINGVAQELLRLVRATAGGAHGADADHLAADGELRGTERVYRRLARLLDAGGAWRPDDPGDPVDAEGRPRRVTTRFVVDVLSGTSAGGINAIFLAKALATGRDLDALQRLWIDEGAIELLIYDGESEFDGVRAPANPPSLLNGRRMYRKLLDAFDGVDAAPVTGTPAPLVAEVDLFVTTTDIAGLPIALRLADGVVAERRHRNVFHFRFPRERAGNGAAAAGPPNGAAGPDVDFARSANPFLAFAARCTSAFPFAFQPMTLRDVDDVRRHAPLHQGAAPVADDGGAWGRHFPAYRGRARTPTGSYAALGADDARETDTRFAEPWLLPSTMRLADRAFGDGGYLDNKPFGHAIDALTSRQKHVVVDRKLLYVEPSPEDVRPTAGGRPNAIENTLAALSLARYETIREDLQRVLGRNRLVERVERVLEGVDDDLAVADVRLPGAPAGAAAEAGAPAGGLPVAAVRAAYAATDLRTMIAAEGPAYGGYHRLKVSALTDEVTEYIAVLAGYDRQSDEFAALRHLVSAWRGDHYVPYLSGPDDARRTENLFLLRYDLSYRRRRLDFVLGRLDRLLCADDGAGRMLDRLGLGPYPTGEAREPFLAALRRLRRELSTSRGELQALRAALLTGDGAPDAWRAAVARVRVTRNQMLEILAPPTGAERADAARRTIAAAGLEGPLAALETALEATIRGVTEPAAARCEAALGARGAPVDPWDPADLARGVVAVFYHQYSRYDQLLFPTYFSTDLGEETDVVDVHRLSPADARALVDPTRGDGRRKLAGTQLANFGAFLDRRWRWNDLLWGRLDAAERLIAILLPGGGREREQARARLTAEAHEAILAEAFGDLDARTLADTVLAGRFAADAAAGDGAGAPPPPPPAPPPRPRPRRRPTTCSPCRGAPSPRRSASG